MTQVGPPRTIQERFAYDAYGTSSVLRPEFASRSSSLYAWETRFAGYRWDDHTGLYVIRSRTYSSGLGSWLQRDPLGYSDGSNLFEYVGSSPVQSTDPSGLSSVRCCAWDAARLCGLARLIGLSAMPACSSCLLIGPGAALCAGACFAIMGITLTAAQIACIIGVFVGCIFGRRR
ncbi:MAG: hypothetical protein KY476_09295 [Planctomycetes bacterium]|nr:hypothetical protein [Planctomycetota bacterium]